MLFREGHHRFDSVGQNVYMLATNWATQLPVDRLQHNLCTKHDLVGRPQTICLRSMSRQVAMWTSGQVMLRGRIVRFDERPRQVVYTDSPLGILQASQTSFIPSSPQTTSFAVVPQLWPFRHSIIRIRTSAPAWRSRPEGLQLKLLTLYLEAGV